MRLFYRIYQRPKKTTKADSPPPPPPTPPLKGAPKSATTETMEPPPEGTAGSAELDPLRAPSPSAAAVEFPAGGHPPLPTTQSQKVPISTHHQQTPTGLVAEKQEARGPSIEATSGEATTLRSKALPTSQTQREEAVQEPARPVVRDPDRAAVKKAKAVLKDPNRPIPKEVAKVAPREVARTVAIENKAVAKELAGPLVQVPSPAPVKEAARGAKEPIRTVVRVPLKVVSKESRKVLPKQQSARSMVKDTMAKDVAVTEHESSVMAEQAKEAVSEHVKGVSKELLKLTARNVTVIDLKPQKIKSDSARAHLCPPKAGETSALTVSAVPAGDRPEPSSRSLPLMAGSDRFPGVPTKTSGWAAHLPAPTRSSAVTADAPVGASPGPPVPCAQASVPTQATTASVPEAAQTPFQEVQEERKPTRAPSLEGPGRLAHRDPTPAQRKEWRKQSPGGVRERKRSSDHRLTEKKKKRTSEARCSLEEKRKKQKRLNDISQHLIALPRSGGNATGGSGRHLPFGGGGQERMTACSPPPVSSPRLAEPPVANSSPASSAPVPPPPIAPVTVVLDRKHRKNPPEPARDNIGALDLSLSARSHPPAPAIAAATSFGQFRPRHVANPAVLDKHRLITCLPAPKYPSYKIVCPSPLSSGSSTMSKKSDGNRHRCKTLTVINPDPTRIVIKNLDMRRDNHHHSQHHHHHHHRH